MADRQELAFLKNALAQTGTDPQEQTALENLLFTRLLTAGLTVNASGVFGLSGATDGQLLIGKTSDHSLNLATLTAGTNISITNSAGGITINATAGGGTVTHTGGALTASALIVGAGAADVAALASLGTVSTVLHGNAAGLPTFGAVSLTADVSGTLGAANGGTGVANNALSTLTISGNFGTTVTVTGTTAVTLPVSGTLLASTGSIAGLTGTIGSAVQDNITRLGSVTSSGPITASGLSDLYTTTWTDYTATSTIVGWASFTSSRKFVMYKQVGKLVFVTFHLEGASNSTSTSFTLPFTSVTVGTVFSFGTVLNIAYDNGAPVTVPATGSVSNNSATFSMNTAYGGGAWTNSGTKIVEGQFWYQTA